MAKMKVIAKPVTLDADRYVNVETGEMLVQDGRKIKAAEVTDKAAVSSSDFVTIDVDAIEWLVERLNDIEIGKITRMAATAKTEYCILSSSNNFPHTPETLAKYLGMNLNKFYEFIRKLVKMNVIAYCVCAPSGYIQKIYMLNPYIARKRKTIDRTLLTFFRDIRNIKSFND